MRALAALRVGRQDVSADLLQIIAERQQMPRVRHMAVMGLYEMGGARARAALTAAVEHADAVTAPAIALGLGRIGTPDSLALVRRLERIAPSHAKHRVRFAATLLAYRYGRKGYDVRVPGGKALQDLGRRRSQLVSVRRARENDAMRALEALGREPLDVAVVPAQALRLDCEPNTFMWLWTSDTAVGGLSALADRKGVAGVLFRKHPILDAYSLSAIGLATPRPRGIRLTLHRAATGALVYAGILSSDGSFELRTSNRPGLAAVDIRAKIEAGKVAMTTAKSATTRREARTPKQA